MQELENTVAVENLELQEQQSDRRDLEETLVKLEKHKEKLVQQIKTIRQLCYEESQQVEQWFRVEGSDCRHRNAAGHLNQRTKLDNNHIRSERVLYFR